MTSDYKTIRQDNKREYGEGIGRYGPMLLANRYADRNHFIYELLQNAEDALGRREAWHGPRAVRFRLDDTMLRVSHFGQPFNERDVRGICGIGESTKKLTAIGRFGIGFKSVFAFTDRPEVHSGEETFAIDSFVLPIATDAAHRYQDETVILIPLDPTDKAAHKEIEDGLSRLGASALLFLSQIDEIRWEVSTGRSGTYLREATDIAPGVRRVTVIGQEEGGPEADEDWLVFSRPVATTEGTDVGQVEIAWALESDNRTGIELRPVDSSPLVVYFPTVLETHLGFLVQGPYRTTPSRDNVPAGDSWNQHCVDVTSKLLVDVLRWLRDRNALDVAGLQCLPMETSKFPADSMFRPFFREARAALSSEDLLPAFGGGYASAANSRLARTQDLRELLDPDQLAALYGPVSPIRWLSGDISQRRTPALHRYLTRELGVDEVTPETLLQELDRQFLEQQSDEWVEHLYAFLDSQPALRKRVATLPILRLADGSHVPPFVDEQPQAFLPGTVESSFPTIRPTVCRSSIARTFLEALGLTTPDPVDDVIRNVLPKYENDAVISDAEYERDVHRFLDAARTDSKAQREKLTNALRETPWVMTVNAGDHAERREKAGDAYLATDRLTELFAGIDGIHIVNGRFACLRGEEARELLETSGATRYLRLTKTGCDLSWAELRDIRREAGLEARTWGMPSDSTLRGVEDVLECLSALEADPRRQRAQCLWRALADLYERRGANAFQATYTWGYSHETRTVSFGAAFVRRLQNTKWIPDAGGNLQLPSLVGFDALGWASNPFLESTIRFKPPIIDRLAEEAGIEAAALDLLKRLGITSEADLRARLGVDQSDAPTQSSADGGPATARHPTGSASTPSVTDDGSPTKDIPPLEPRTTDSVTHLATQGGLDGGAAAADGRSGASSGRATQKTIQQPKEGAGPQRFVSYVATQPRTDAPDPDGLDHAARMSLEQDAIDFILKREPEWQRTELNNPGFDLYQGPTAQLATCWCEVKAMTTALQHRPVGLSRTQFQLAQDHGTAYWLYIVERAGTAAARLVRIQDPAGKAATFTFDEGWQAVAELSL